MWMTILLYLLLFIEIASSLMLIGVILLQRTKGQGIGLAFGAGMGEALFGAHMGNVLTKTTVILAVVFLANTTILAIVGSNREEQSVVDMLPAAPATPAAPAQQPFQVPGETTGGGAMDGMDGMQEVPETPSIPLTIPGSDGSMQVPMQVPGTETAPMGETEMPEAESAPLPMTQPDAAPAPAE